MVVVGKERYRGMEEKRGVRNKRRDVEGCDV